MKISYKIVMNSKTDFINPHCGGIYSSSLPACVAHPLFGSFMTWKWCDASWTGRIEYLTILVFSHLHSPYSWRVGNLKVFNRKWAEFTRHCYLPVIIHSLFKLRKGVYIRRGVVIFETCRVRTNVKCKCVGMINDGLKLCRSLLAFHITLDMKIIITKLI